MIEESRATTEVRADDESAGGLYMKIRRPTQIEVEFGILGTFLLATLIISTGSGLAGYL